MKKNVMVLALSFLLALLFTSCETEVNTLYHWYTVESGSISESDYNKAVSSEWKILYIGMGSCLQYKCSFEGNLFR